MSELLTRAGQLVYDRAKSLCQGSSTFAASDYKRDFRGVAFHKNMWTQDYEDAVKKFNALANSTFPFDASQLSEKKSPTTYQDVAEVLLESYGIKVVP